MSDLNNEEKKNLYLKRVHWLRNNVPPDDIYEFAEQSLSSAHYLCRVLNDWIDLNQEIDKNTILGGIIKNIISMRVLESENYLGGLSIGIFPGEDE